MNVEAHGGLRVDASIATGDGGTSSQRTSGLSDAMLAFDATWMEKGTARPSQSTPQKNHHWQLLSVNFGKSSNEKHCHEIASMHGTFDTTTSTHVQRLSVLRVSMIGLQCFVHDCLG